MPISGPSFATLLAIFFFHIFLYGAGGVWLIYAHKEQRDRSRLVLGLFSLAMAASCTFFILTNIFAPPEKQFANSMLEPYPTMISFLVWLMIPIYVFEIKNPNQLFWDKFFIGIGPWLVACAAFLIWHASTGFAVVTPITSFGYLFEHIHSTEVILRVILALIFFPYMFIMLIQSKDWRKTSAPQPWTNIISSLACGFTFTFVFGMLCRLEWIMLAHVVLIDIVIVIGLYFERHIRIPVPEQTYPEVKPKALQKTNKHLNDANESVKQVAIKLQEILQTGIWQNPDYNRDDYCRLVGTNRQYMAQAVQVLGYDNLANMLNTYRMESLTQLMENNPTAKIQDLVFQAGFRNRATADRLFQEKFGCSLTAYHRGGVK